MRLLCSLFLLCSAALFATNNSEKPSVPAKQEGPRAADSVAPLVIDGRKWKIAHEAKDEGKVIREFVLENEDPNHWTELFSIQQFSDVPVTPKEFFKLFVDGLKQAAPQNKVESRITSDSSNVLLGEWWIQDKTPNDQHEWIKIFKDGDELLIVRYTTKKIDEVEKIRGKWEAFLKDFQASKEP